MKTTSTSASKKLIRTSLAYGWHTIVNHPRLYVQSVLVYGAIMLAAALLLFPVVKDLLQPSTLMTYFLQHDNWPVKLNIILVGLGYLLAMAYCEIVFLRKLFAIYDTGDAEGVSQRSATHYYPRFLFNIFVKIFLVLLVVVACLLVLWVTVKFLSPLFYSWFSLQYATILANVAAVAAIAVCILGICCIIYFMVSSCFVNYVFIDTQCGTREAFKRSFHLVRNNFFSCLCLICVTGLMRPHWSLTALIKFGIDAAFVHGYRTLAAKKSLTTTQETL